MTKILEKRIDALEERLAAVEQRTAPPMANGPPVTSATGEKFVWANPDNAWLEGLFGRFKAEMLILDTDHWSLLTRRDVVARALAARLAASGEPVAGALSTAAHNLRYIRT